jgi:hypothetical protein
MIRPYGRERNWLSEGNSKYRDQPETIGVWGLPALNWMPMDPRSPANRPARNAPAAWRRTVLNPYLARIRAATGNLTQPIRYTTQPLGCPGANVCKIGCFARQSRFLYDEVQMNRFARLEFTTHPDFVETLAAELIRRRFRFVRIHDSGDFYSPEYRDRWYEIIRRVEAAKIGTKFWAYTKSIPLFKSSPTAWRPGKPESLRLIFSVGGKADHWIDPVRDPHSYIFHSHEDLYRAGYGDATGQHEIEVVFFTTLIGLVYHGNITSMKYLDKMIVAPTQIRRLKQMQHAAMEKESERWQRAYRGFPGRVPGREYLPSVSRLSRERFARPEIVNPPEATVDLSRAVPITPLQRR